MSLRDLLPIPRRSRKTAPLFRWGGEPSIWALHREIDALFDRFVRSLGIGSITLDWPDIGVDFPRVNVYETDKTVEVEAELPGVDKKDIDIEINDTFLTLKVEKKEDSEEKKRDWYRRECIYGSFSRVISLPSAVDSNKATAKFKNGILKLSLPKLEEGRKKQTIIIEE